MKCPSILCRHGIVIWIGSMALAIFSLGCKENTSSAHQSNSPTPTREQSLYDEVIAVHDRAMEKMTDLATQNSKLRTYIQSLDTSQAPDKTTQLAEATRFAESLNRADKNMWDWMFQFKKKKDWASKTPYTDYLSSELEKVHRVDSAIVHAIEDAESFLQKNQ